MQDKQRKASFFKTPSPLQFIYLFLYESKMLSMSGLSSEITGFRLKIDERLGELVPNLETPFHQLFDAARYSLLSPGKRLRGILTCAVTDCFAVNSAQALDTACAIEMIHAYSLIHDDLPCMDDDDLRRGRPTLHKVYPEWMALLTGDYLLTKSFEVLADSTGLTDSQKLMLIKILSSRSGAEGMIGGQCLDLLQEGQDISLNAMQLTHQLKTGALIQASCECGGVIAGVEEKVLDSLRLFGGHIGLAFQIYDDILDVEGDESILGKPIGSDEGNTKSTYVSLLGLDGAKEKAHQLIEEAITTISALSPKSENLITIARFFTSRRV